MQSSAKSRTHEHTSTHTYRHAHSYMHANTHTHTHIHAYTHKRTNTHTPNTHSQTQASGKYLMTCTNGEEMKCGVCGALYLALLVQDVRRASSIFQRFRFWQLFFTYYMYIGIQVSYYWLVREKVSHIVYSNQQAYHLIWPESIHTVRHCLFDTSSLSDDAIV